MKKFKSVRNGQVAELVSENEEQIIVKLESGEEKAIRPATLKRWWKEMEEEVEEQPQSEEVNVIDITENKDTPITHDIQEEATEQLVEEPAEETEEVSVEQEEPTNEESVPEEQEPAAAKPEKKAKDKKEPKEKREPISGDHPLKGFIEQLASERGTEVFEATVPSFRSLKVDGKMYMAFTFNKKGVTLWMRSAAVQELTEYKKMNHMFDARVQFGEDNAENRKEITKLLDASLKFQIDKQAARASKK